MAYWLAANHPERVERCIAIDAPAVLDPAMIDQVKPSLDRLARVYPSWDEYLALVKSMPYFDEGGWDDDVESYFRADVRVGTDGTVQARCRPEHIEEVIRGEFEVDWPTVAARIGQPTLLLRAPGSFGPPGSPPLLSREEADRTAAAMADCRVVDGVGQPPHIRVRARGAGPDGCDRGVPGRGAVVKGRGTGYDPTAGVIRWRWR